MTQPDPLELVAELRRSVGLFDGAMPITPEQAWQEALARVALFRQQLTDCKKELFETKDQLFDRQQISSADPAVNLFVALAYADGYITERDGKPHPYVHAQYELWKQRLLERQSA